MRKIWACVGLLLTCPVAEAAPNCSVPRIATLHNQTVTGYMTVKRGKSCSIVMGSSRGPTSGASIEKRPAHGSVQIRGANAIVYRPQAGYVGKDAFTYARRGLDTQNNVSVRTVQVDVTVVP